MRVLPLVPQSLGDSLGPGLREVGGASSKRVPPGMLYGTQLDGGACRPVLLLSSHCLPGVGDPWGRRMRSSGRGHVKLCVTRCVWVVPSPGLCHLPCAYDEPYLAFRTPIR